MPASPCPLLSPCPGACCSSWRWPSAAKQRRGRARPKPWRPPETPSPSSSTGGRSRTSLPKRPRWAWGQGGGETPNDPKMGCPAISPLLFSSPPPPTPKIAELEKRLAQLEATVRCEPDSQVRGRGCRPAPRPAPRLAPRLTPISFPTEPAAGGAEGHQPGGESGRAGGLEGSLSLHPVPRALGGGDGDTVLGCCRVPPHPVLCPQETVQVLQAKVNILDVAVLDQVEARLQVRGGGRGQSLGAPRWQLALRG